MKEPRVVIMLLSLSVAVAFAQAPSPPKLPHPSSEARISLPKEGLVPDKETAIKLAEVILFRLYGEKNIVAQKPYAVTENQNIWWVCGAPPPALGSSFEIAISRQTGAVLHLQH